MPKHLEEGTSMDPHVEATSPHIGETMQCRFRCFLKTHQNPSIQNPHAYMHWECRLDM
ncbi:hypothetical protein KP509_01G102700 [Ceratopteris richardii]|uniref:Uncharacterized protein n=1 Tax=Ceratopteris richardii TaxID=49495 RepID=A0A8T2VJD1_CERRI|nr:hypothetical protein KP509_01G102700 [Ceratopteris richardii]